MKILVVEDDRTVGQYVKRGLEEQRYQADLVDDGMEGLRLASGGRYDLIVLDLRLPGMNGFEMLRTLRDRGTTTPVLVLTAQDSVDFKVQALRAGADDYVTKPFKTADLLDRVRVWIRTRQYLKASSGLPDGPAAEDQPVLSMALSTSHDLIRLLVLLLGLLESWETNAPSAEDISRLRVEFGEAATALAARINALTRAAHYPA
jgi:DNA-binding response OmpR family regulator